jgi:hypothetical protein
VEYKKRRQGRKEIIKTIEFSFDLLPSDELVDGCIINISESGCCLLSANSLNKGQVIKIQNSDHGESQTATVRWSERCNNLYSESGLEFV